MTHGNIAQQLKTMMKRPSGLKADAQARKSQDITIQVYLGL